LPTFKGNIGVTYIHDTQSVFQVFGGLKPRWNYISRKRGFAEKTNIPAACLRVFTMQ